MDELFHNSNCHAVGVVGLILFVFKVHIKVYVYSGSTEGPVKIDLGVVYILCK